MKRYWYIVWRRGNPKTQILRWSVLDFDPAEFLIRNIGADQRNDVSDGQGDIIVINQFEITAEQFQRLESLQ